MDLLAFIPIELQRLCVEYLDTSSLKALRLVSHAFSKIATDILFNTIMLRFNYESALYFNNVLADQRLKQMVRRIVINGELPDRTGQDFDEEFDSDWALAIKKISIFPALNSVEMRFHEAVGEGSHYMEQTLKYRTKFMLQSFQSLKNSESVQTLFISNLQDALCSCRGYEDPLVKPIEKRNTKPYSCDDKGCWCNNKDFIAMRSRLKKLSLLIATEYMDHVPHRSIEKEALHKCFAGSGLLDLWLRPIQSNLTHLTLYSDAYWGVWPYTNLRQVHFLNLKSLALGNLTIAHTWQIDWITSHGSTLEELILDDCPIVYAMQISKEIADANWPNLRPLAVWGNLEEDATHIIHLISIRWHDILPRFKGAFRKLKHFGMGHGTWDEKTMVEKRYELPAKLETSRYVSFRVGYGPSPWMEDDLEERSDDYTSLEWVNEKGEFVDIKIPDCDREDQGALDDFLEAIGYSKEQRETMAAKGPSYHSLKSLYLLAAERLALEPNGLSVFPV